MFTATKQEVIRLFISWTPVHEDTGQAAQSRLKMWNGLDRPTKSLYDTGRPLSNPQSECSDVQERAAGHPTEAEDSSGDAVCSCASRESRITSTSATVFRAASRAAARMKSLIDRP